VSHNVLIGENQSGIITFVFWRNLC